jgi:hypothetical protein
VGHDGVAGAQADVCRKQHPVRDLLVHPLVLRNLLRRRVLNPARDVRCNPLVFDLRASVLAVPLEGAVQMSVVRHVFE